MDALLIKSIIFSQEPDTPETEGSSNAVMVPDPDSEYGYKVEEAPSTWRELTEEEFIAENSSSNAIETMELSSKFPFLFALTASICLVYLLDRFLKSGAGRMKWLGNILLTAVFFALFQYHWWIRLPRSVYYLFPVLEVVLLLAVISLVSRKSFSKKIYIAVTFQAVFGLCEVLRSYGELFLERLGGYLGIASNAESFLLYSYMADPADAYPYASLNIRVYLDWEACLMLVLSCAVMILSVRKLARGGHRNMEEIPRSELYFLLTPAFAAIVYSVFTGVARLLLRNTVFVNWATWDSPAQSMTLYLMIPSLAVASLVCILYAYTIYQKLITYMEEKQRAVILANQVEQMQGHIREIEQLYTGIRSMRHDMQNYLFDIKSLLAARGIDVEEKGSELAGYFSGIGNSLDALNYSIHTGHPVTDVVLNGKAGRARERSIRFDSEFRFPSDFGIDAFDLSIILNNSLDNALEACELLLEQTPEAGAYIEVTSCCKGNMFLMEVENSCDGVLLEAESTAAPLTRKKDTARHGLGFQNILRCSEKYFGSAKYSCIGQTFHLTVMLQKAENNPAAG